MNESVDLGNNCSYWNIILNNVIQVIENQKWAWPRNLPRVIQVVVWTLVHTTT